MSPRHVITPVPSRAHALPSLRGLLLAVYLALLAMVVVLPSGYAYGFNVKVTAFLLTLAVTVLYLVQHRERAFPRDFLLGFVVSLLAFVTFLMASLLVSTFGLRTELRYSLAAFQNIASAIALVFLSYFLYAEKLLPFATFLRYALRFNLLFSLLKLVTAGLILVGVTDFAQTSAFIRQGLRYDFISLQISEGLYRFQFINDSLTPFLLFFALISERLGVRLRPAFRALYLVVSLMSIFLAFTRFVWFLAAAAVLAYLVATGNRKLTLALGVSVIAFVFAADGELIGRIIEERFTSQGVAYSDQLRFEQTDALVREIVAAPFLGRGIGSYSEDIIRSEASPYSYEVQWLAFGMQFGLLGLALLVLYASLIVVRLLTPGFNKLTLTVLAMYFLWLLSGFTNPYLASSVGGVVFALFYLSAIHLSQARRGRQVWHR